MSSRARRWSSVPMAVQQVEEGAEIVGVVVVVVDDVDVDVDGDGDGDGDGDEVSKSARRPASRARAGECPTASPTRAARRGVSESATLTSLLKRTTASR